jgi:hypothetical protein
MTLGDGPRAREIGPWSSQWMSPCGGVPVDGVASDRSTTRVARLVNCRLLGHDAGCLVHRAVHRWEARSSLARSASHEQGHRGPASARVRCPCRPLPSGRQSPCPHPLHYQIVADGPPASYWTLVPYRRGGGRAEGEAALLRALGFSTEVGGRHMAEDSRQGGPALLEAQCSAGERIDEAELPSVVPPIAPTSARRLGARAN